MKQIRKPLVLAILDGWGVGPKNKKINAIEAAKTPFYDYLVKNYPYTELDATGTAVGLEENQMSGSETGHLNIGAGRIIKQDVRIILEEIANGNFFQNPIFLSTINHVKKLDSDIHLMGLMGNNDSPHSHPDIFLALLVLLKKKNFEGNVYFHFFTDGRDSFPQSAFKHWDKWRTMIEKVGIGKLASVTGRFYAMDRVKNWNRLLVAYNVLTRGEGFKAKDFNQIIQFNYQKGNTDEYIKPAVLIEKNNEPVGLIKENDGVIFFNLRSDRARQFSKFFVGNKLKIEKGFPQIKTLKNLCFVAMTDFGPDLNLKTAYSIPPVRATLPAILSNFKQLYIAETEKFAHITYFINGGFPDSVGGEEKIKIQSPKVRSYAEKPEMSAMEITRIVKENIKREVYDFIAINYANADMVGHTGDFEATKKAVEIIDENLKNLYQSIKEKKGTMIITADHGNADIMWDKRTKQPFTFHTKNPVPFIIAGEDLRVKKLKLKTDGKLANIAPTILKILDIYQPEEMIEEPLF